MSNNQDPPASARVTFRPERVFLAERIVRPPPTPEPCIWCGLPSDSEKNFGWFLFSGEPQYTERTETHLRCSRCQSELACRIPSRALAFDVEWHDPDLADCFIDVMGDPWGRWAFWIGNDSMHDAGDEDRS